MVARSRNSVVDVITLSLALSALATPISAQEETEKALRFVPLLTSSPLLGLGAGAAASYLYDTGDDDSSKSQLEIGGQYSSTKSYVIFANNKAFFKDNP